MSISAKTALRRAVVYLLAALAVAGFGAVYELFSHQVYSCWMLYAFALPLTLGTLPLLLLALGERDLPGPLACSAWRGGVAWLTMGSVIRGALEIYGTTNRLWGVYPVVGAALLVLGGAGARVSVNSE